MNKVLRAINNSNVSRFRFYIQLLFFGLLIYGGYLAINIGDQLPTFSCVFNTDRGGSCYLMGFQHQMSLPFKSLFSGRGIGVLIGLASFIGWFVLLNKSWCGFICPLGTLQDWLSKVRQKLKIRPAEYSASMFAGLSTVKYFLLVLLILIPMAMGNSFFGLPTLNHDFTVPFCMICPGRTVLPIMTGDFSQLTIDFSTKTKMVFTVLGMAVTGIFVVGSLVKNRFFCLFCPMSAFHYIFSKIAFLKLKKDGSKCTKCGNCYRACDVGIRDIADDIDSTDILKDDCMLCLKCIEVCPENKCLTASFIGIPIFQSTEQGFFKRQEGRRGK